MSGQGDCSGNQKCRLCECDFSHAESPGTRRTPFFGLTQRRRERQILCVSAPLRETENLCKHCAFRGLSERIANSEVKSWAAEITSSMRARAGVNPLSQRKRPPADLTIHRRPGSEGQASRVMVLASRTNTRFVSLDRVVARTAKEMWHPVQAVIRKAGSRSPSLTRRVAEGTSTATRKPPIWTHGAGTSTPCGTGAGTGAGVGTTFVIGAELTGVGEVRVTIGLAEPCAPSPA
jgi:hypothetical protein